jgi:hypothetical protein
MTSSNRPRPYLAFIAVLGFALIGALPICAQEPSPADLEHFEKEIRPLLVKHCHECHGPKGTPEGNLRLDARANWLKGGDTGPAIIPGKPEESPFIKAIRYGGDIEMPPTEKLSPEVIKTFEDWVARGAPAPKGDGTAIAKRVIDIEQGREFWSYRPITNPSPPPVKAETWAKNPIDDFILAKLEAEGLEPSLEASREVLVRRLYFDLWGLPPTPEQIDEFVQDESPYAYEKLIEKLVDSRHFGERFGRHWLDVARYGESLTLRGFVLPNAWRYRDYVIGAFNRDLPYDEFIRQQIAGDLLLNEAPEGDIAERRRRAIAVAFLSLGNNNLEEQDKKQLDMDVVDEQLDVLSKAFLAQTITCARCHDHKFDPIPAKDYYALAGILRNTQLLEHENVSKWIEVTLPLSTAQEIERDEKQNSIAQGAAKLTELKREIAQLKAELGHNAEQGKIVSVTDLPGIVVDDSEAKKVGEWTHSTSVKPYIGSGYLHDNDAFKGEKTLTFAPKLPTDGKYEVRLAYTPGDNRSPAAPITIFGADGEKELTINMKSTPPIDGRFVSLGEHRFEAAGQSFVIVANEGTQGHVIADAVQFLPLGAADSAIVAQVEPQANRNEKQTSLDKLQSEVVELDKTLKKQKDDVASFPKSMAPRERPEITDCPVHLRGSVHTLGEVAPRGVLQVAQLGPAPTFPSNQSGRKELADWIASKDNPLTARVYVNRLWHWLFGAGFVRSVDNFGSTGETPSHPELLDHLATELIDNDWSTKKLIRTIVMSRTYRQASKENEKAIAIDPENRLLWRMNRKRLEAECLRDAMLVASGRLSNTAGGQTYPANLAADYGFSNDSLDRSVFLPVFRNALPASFEPFDFADPSMVVGARNVSTIAPQALYLLNNPFPRQCAIEAATQIINQSDSDSEKIDLAFRKTLGRHPSDSERAAITSALHAEGPTLEEKWTRIFHSLFCTLDFRYRD